MQLCVVIPCQHTVELASGTVWLYAHVVWYSNKPAHMQLSSVHLSRWLYLTVDAAGCEGVF